VTVSKNRNKKRCWFMLMFHFIRLKNKCGLVEVITLKVWRSPPWTCLTVAEYLCHKWTRICPVLRKHTPVLSSFMTYHRIYNKSNTNDKKRCWFMLMFHFIRLKNKCSHLIIYIQDHSCKMKWHINLYMYL
jgi:hypothetical protein